MRICYFIQNHLAPPQVARLVRTLRRAQPDCAILVGHDEFAGHCSVDHLRSSLDVDILATGEPARRGYLSILRPYFEAVEWLAGHGVAYDWLVYLSAQDYPTRPLRDLTTLLESSGCDGFLRFWNAADPKNPWGRRNQGLRRYHYQYFDAPRWSTAALRLLRAGNGIQSWMHLHLVYGPRVGFRRGGSPFGPALSCYAGTQWTILKRECAEYVAERVRSDQSLMHWFSRTVCPCESVVQTLLVNSGRFRLHDDDLRFVDFTASRNGSPRTLTAGDLPALTGGSHYFARKFDLHHDARVLDLLDERIG